MLQISDRVAVFYAGRLVELAPAADLRRAPQHPYTRMLLRAFPSLDGEVTALQPIPGSPPSLVNPPTGCRFHPRCDVSVPNCQSHVPQLRPLSVRHFAACHLAEPRENPVPATSLSINAPIRLHPINAALYFLTGMPPSGNFNGFVRGDSFQHRTDMVLEFSNTNSSHAIDYARQWAPESTVLPKPLPSREDRFDSLERHVLTGAL